jgi:hypothetical protein
MGVVGFDINHALIQYYENGHSWISEHSDKTIDITPGTFILNLSLGATRTMILKKKDKTQKQRFSLPHNSLVVMDLDTNKKWLHSIKQDKRLDNMKDADELFENGERISLTFRSISTFVKNGRLFGQGAKCKTIDELDSESESKYNTMDEEYKMLEAFGKENYNSDFDWNLNYGFGFDVIDLRRINQNQ